MRNWLFVAVFLLASTKCFRLRSLKVRMGGQDGDGMDGSNWLKNLFGWQSGFSIRICSENSSGAESCCTATTLNTDDDNWQVGEVNFFVGRQLKGCENFAANLDKPVKFTLKHKGPDGARILSVDLWGSMRELGFHYMCVIGVKLDNSDEFETMCGGYEPAVLSRCNGHPDFCRLSVDNFTFAGAHNAGTGGESFGDVQDCFVKNHDLNIQEMLDFGLRFFDFDINYRADCGSLVTGHGMSNNFFYYCFSEMEAVLGSLEEWLDDNPGEVVILYFGQILNDSEALPKLEQLLEQTFTDKIYGGPWDNWPTVGQAVNANKRIFVVIRHENVQSQKYIQEIQLKLGKPVRNARQGPSKKILSTYKSVSVGSQCQAVVDAAEESCSSIRGADMVKLAVFGRYQLLTSCLSTNARTCNPRIGDAIEACRKYYPTINFLQVDYPNYPASVNSVVDYARAENLKRL